MPSLWQSWCQVWLCPSHHNAWRAAFAEFLVGKATESLSRVYFDTVRCYLDGGVRQWDLNPEPGSPGMQSRLGISL